MHTDLMVYSLRISYRFYIVEKLNAREGMFNLRVPLQLEVGVGTVCSPVSTDL